MTLALYDQPVRKIGVIGSGQIGPDIALYFAKVFHRDSVPICVVDVSPEALQRGQQKMHRKIDKGVETRAFSPAMGAAMKAACTFTSDYEALRGADLVVEAATENRELKNRIFRQLEGLVAPAAVLASNSSHLEPEVIFEGLTDRSRTLVIHYFFPAERNPVVEVVPGRDTSTATTAAVMRFYEGMGKVPIRVKSRFGYAIDPIFEGIFHAAARLVEAGHGTTREVDAVACRALGLTVGPFTAMNLTGGNPITYPALEIYAQRIMPWFRSTRLLAEALAAGTAWEVPGRGEVVELAPEREERLSAALRGAYFGLACEVVDAGLVSESDLDMAVELALDLRAPFRFMNELGVPAALAVVQRYARDFDGFRVPAVLERQAASGQPWALSSLVRDDRGDVAVVKIRRPKVLNALDQAAFDEIADTLAQVDADPRFVGAVLTGFGVKAFVSGADVNFLARIASPQEGQRTAAASQRSLDRIAALRKPVVCALNGFAFGGGNELAMACRARIARADLDLLASQPEVNLGIIPGAGATQRLPRLIGLERAAQLLRTGGSVASRQAREWGLIRAEVEGELEDLLGAAVQLVREAASGRVVLEPLDTSPLTVPAGLPEVDLGHRSRAVDAILCRAILEGCRLPLAQGLALEARLFGEVCATQDMRIGVRNFLEKGPRHPAPFVHA